jgi:hypothetical protein
MIRSRSVLRVISVLVTGSLVGEATPFELATHGAMSASAISSSRLGTGSISNELLRQLGVVDFAASNGSLLYPPFGLQYVDIGSSLVARKALPIEQDVIKKLNDSSGISVPDSFRLGGWILSGAIREDDNEVTNGPKAAAELKSDEPGGVFNRVPGHFFDPRNDAGLSVAGIAIQPRAVDWALEPGAAVNTLAPRENHRQCRAG